jgi:hypothetical protein
MDAVQVHQQKEERNKQENLVSCLDEPLVNIQTNSEI